VSDGTRDSARIARPDARGRRLSRAGVPTIRQRFLSWLSRNGLLGCEGDEALCMTPGSCRRWKLAGSSVPDRQDHLRLWPRRCSKLHGTRHRARGQHSRQRARAHRLLSARHKLQEGDFGIRVAAARGSAGSSSRIIPVGETFGAKEEIHSEYPWPRWATLLMVAGVIACGGRLSKLAGSETEESNGGTGNACIPADADTSSTAGQGALAGCVPKPDAAICGPTGCEPLCGTSEYALTCTGSLRVIPPEPDSSLECHVLPLPGLVSYYCCPCVQ
jgi:hypothetical protein